MDTPIQMLGRGQRDNSPSWHQDGLIIVAITMFPERFTQEEIRCGVIMFLVHAPNHIAAAAKLGGWPVEDIFEVGALDGRENS